MTGEPSVVIVGGGFAGVNAAKALDAYAQVVLVEPKDTFVYNVACLRALVEADFAPRIFLPYDNLLARGYVEHDRAVEVGARRVVLASGKVLAADYVVLASGSRYAFPAKTDRDHSSDALTDFRMTRDRLERTTRVLLIGAGGVGIELAGEIKAAFPRTHVILLDAADDLFAGQFRADLRAELRAQLAELGVELVLGEPLRALPATAATELGTFTVTTEAGRDITADMWFRCFGVAPVSDYLDAGLASARDQNGFVRVTPTLLVDGFDTVFAIGDVSTADAKMAGRAGRQGHVVAENIRKLSAGDRALSRYEPLEPAIIIPIGPTMGSGQLPNQQDLASRELVSAVKGRDLMVKRYAEILGVSAT